MNAQDAFIGKCSEIDALLSRLQAVRAEHFGADPDFVDWGHVGSATHIAELLKQAAEFAEGAMS